MTPALRAIEAAVRAVPWKTIVHPHAPDPKDWHESVPDYPAIARVVGALLGDTQAAVDALVIAHDRADGALADAATVPTGNLERGIRALTAERDALRKALQARRETS